MKKFLILSLDSTDDNDQALTVDHDTNDIEDAIAIYNEKMAILSNVYLVQTIAQQEHI